MKAPRTRVEQPRESRNEFLAGQFLIVDLISDNRALRTYGLVLNISKGGMAVQTFRPLGLGRIAEIRLAFPRASFSTGAGLVAWQKEGGLAGIRFLNAPLKNLAELRQRVEQDFSPRNSDSALPLLACRSTSRTSSTNEFDTTLHLFASSAMALTGANGAAIALGNSDGMECRASVGSAPEVGTQLNPDSGLSGHSLRTGAVNLCDDAWADSRVNIAAAQQLDTHSIMIVPITMAGTVVGLLEAFSRDTNHFDKRHVQQLQPLVNVLATLPELEPAPKPAPKNETPENVPELMPVAAAQDAAAADNVETVEQQEPAALHFADDSQSTNRFRPIAIAVGILAVLFVLIFAVAWFASRDRTKSLGKSNSSIAAQDVVQQSSNGATEHAAASNETPVISFHPPRD
jgi:GAF domain-containing protein